MIQKRYIRMLSNASRESWRKMKWRSLRFKELVRKTLILGITNQRETTVAWDRDTGKPLYDAVVWLDKRNQDIVEQLIKDINAYRRITGLPIATYFSATKMKWMLQNIKQIKEAETKGKLWFGTIDSWLVHRLTGGKKYITEATNASRTMLMNLKTLKWDKRMMDIFEIKEECLPKIVKESASRFGSISESVLSGVPITGILGDQQSACLGHTLLEGEVKSTYGTGCFILMNWGNKPVYSKNGLLSTVLYKLDKKLPTQYALEGAVEWGGVTIEWAKNNMGLFKDFTEFNQLLSSVEDSGGVYFVPAFSGLFSPYWRNDIRGTILGLSLHTQKGHILRALTNAIWMRSKEVIDAMKRDSKSSISKIFVDGGVSTNSALMQTQADFLDREVVNKKEKEITAIGAGIASGLKLGIWKDLDEIRDIIQVENVFKSKISDEEREENEGRWKDAINRSLGWM
jgi:glycerol kinase